MGIDDERKPRWSKTAIAAAAEAARKHGVTIRLERNGTMTIIPYVSAADQNAEPELDDGLEKW